MTTCPKCGAKVLVGYTFKCGSKTEAINSVLTGEFLQSNRCRIAELEAENAKLTSNLHHQIADECEADIAIRVIAEPLIGKEAAYGSGYMPPLVDVVKSLVGKLAEPCVHEAYRRWASETKPAD